VNRHLDLRQRTNTHCTDLDREARDETDDDGLCTMFVSVLDGLPVRSVGGWAYDKIYRLVQYFGIFAGGMKNQWDALNYLEIGSGPGRCIAREDCTEMDGTALAVVRNPRFVSLKRALFIDASSRVTEILNQRLAALGCTPKAEAIIGNYEDPSSLYRTIDSLPPRSLNFVFIDPTECDVPFVTIESLVRRLRNADLLINVALGTDVNRNIVPAILSPSHTRAREKYEGFLGAPGFCARDEIIELAKRSDHDILRRKFAETYNESLRRIGYVHTDIRPVRHYYYLLFASKKHTGLDFWLKSCKIGPDDQRELL
jgi:three-Cys-motif partner protein